MRIHYPSVVLAFNWSLATNVHDEIKIRRTETRNTEAISEEKKFNIFVKIKLLNVDIMGTGNHFIGDPFILYVFNDILAIQFKIAQTNTYVYKIDRHSHCNLPLTGAQRWLRIRAYTYI